ncbi:MAG: hypothetical protein M3680_19065 [Myxococcota bacterium]|nr:hypothetical protein [Myxococcota bacterium]
MGGSALGGCATDEPAGAGDPPAGAGQLTCAMLAAPTRCWQVALAEVAACAPGEGEVGTLSSDRTSCTYADGSHVAFATPPSTTSDPDWDFTLTTDDALCAAVVVPSGRDDARWTVTTASGPVVFEYGETVRLSCRDGEVFAMSSLAYLECGFKFAPGDVTRVTDDHVSFSLHGGATGSVPVVRCER